MTTNSNAFGSSFTMADIQRAVDQLRTWSKPAVAQVLCSERMVPDARLVAPPPEAALQGIPIRVTNLVPHGFLVLMSAAGEIIGIIGPEKGQ